MLAHHRMQGLCGIACALAASLLFAAPVAAAQERPVVVYGDPDSVRIERVRFADLDLDTVTGRNRLHHRVGAAVDRVCLLELGRDGLQLPGYYDCATGAWGDAVPKIAQAIERSKELALTGQTSIAATAITISAGS
jgi:UrcA family protein